MRRVASVLAALALVALVAAPVSADQLTLRSATVDHYGVLTLSGTDVCPSGMEGQQFTIQGSVTQVFNRKFVVSGQINPNGSPNGTCNPNGGLTPWTVTLTANSNLFSTGWATVSLNVQGGGCTDPNDQSTCYGFNDGGQFTVKITRK